MHRLYVLPQEVWAGSAQVGTHFESDGTSKPVMVRWTDMFHPMFGSHYLDLDKPGGLILMVTDLSHDERVEDLFHAHPDVAVLPNPTTQGNVKLKDHIGAQGYKYAQVHHDALKSCLYLNIKDTDTILDVHRKAGLANPHMALRNKL